MIHHFKAKLCCTAWVLMWMAGNVNATISLSNSTWTFSTNGLQEATLTSPSQGDAFDITNMITLEQVGGNTDAMTGSISEDDTLNRVTWADDIHSNGNFSITNWQANEVVGHQAFRFSFDLNNISASSYGYTLDFRYEVGADSGTQIIDTSDGDTLWEASDSWVVSDDSSTTSGDPAVYSTWLLSAPDSVDRFTGGHGGLEVFERTYSGTLTGGSSTSFAFIIGIESTAALAQATAPLVVPELSGMVFVLIACSAGMLFLRRH